MQSSNALWNTFRMEFGSSDILAVVVTWWLVTTQFEKCWTNALKCRGSGGRLFTFNKTAEVQQPGSFELLRWESDCMWATLTQQQASLLPFHSNSAHDFPFPACVYFKTIIKQNNFGGSMANWCELTDLAWSAVLHLLVFLVWFYFLWGFLEGQQYEQRNSGCPLSPSLWPKLPLRKKRKEKEQPALQSKTRASAVKKKCMRQELNSIILLLLLL